jgi:hypothetical protein
MQLHNFFIMSFQKILKSILLLICLLLFIKNTDAQIIETQERINFSYFLYTQAAPSPLQLRKLPQGARVEFTDNIDLQKKASLTKMLDETDGKLKFWYRNNWLLTSCQALILKDKIIIAEKTFWPNAEMLLFPISALKAGEYILQIMQDGVVLEARVFGINVVE